MHSPPFKLVLLFCLGSANGAGTLARAALDAHIGVDLIMILALGDSANGASAFARAAGDASISDLISHGILPPVIILHIL